MHIWPLNSWTCPEKTWRMATLPNMFNQRWNFAALPAIFTTSRHWKSLLEVFCLHPIVFGERQNSSSSFFASWGKIKIHDFTLADQYWIGLMIFKSFADHDWIGLIFFGSGLDSDWKISQSAHLCCIGPCASGAPRHGVWVDCSFLPDAPCAWEFGRNAI